MYYPKNRIKTNLYTRGGEYQLKNDKTEYIGYYHKLYNGTFFTGKNPQDSPINELEVFNAIQPSPSSKYISFINPSESPKDNTIYNNIKEKDTTKTYLIPNMCYPQPTQDDYDLGLFTRYFCVKINEEIYYELDKDTYDALISKDKKWAWQMYLPFSILWTLTGDKDEVEKTNYSMVLIQERKIKRKGLNLFLRGKYLKFYKT